VRLGANRLLAADGPIAVSGATASGESLTGDEVIGRHRYNARRLLKVAPLQPLVAVDRSVVLSSAKGENVSPPR
jgi:hypothetical protein